MEFGASGEIGECSGDGVGLSASCGDFVEEAGFDSKQTPLPPSDGGQFFNQTDFDAICGVDSVDVLPMEKREDFLRFSLSDDQVLGQKAVTGGVSGRAEQSCRGDEAAR